MMLRLTLEVKTFSTVLLLALLAISTLMSWAESLRDPTQIPSEIISNENNTANTQNVQTRGPVLQSVMLGAQYRAAIINGKKVKLGEKFEKATLVALSENSATLRNPDGTKLILKMLDSGIKKSTIKMSFYPPKYSDNYRAEIKQSDGQQDTQKHAAHQQATQEQTNSALEKTVKGDSALLFTSDNNPEARLK